MFAGLAPPPNLMTLASAPALAGTDSTTLTATTATDAATPPVSDHCDFVTDGRRQSDATDTDLTFGTVTNNSIVLNAAGSFTRSTSGSSGLHFALTTTGGYGYGCANWSVSAFVNCLLDVETCPSEGLGSFMPRDSQVFLKVPTRRVDVSWDCRWTCLGGLGVRSSWKVLGHRPTSFRCWRRAAANQSFQARWQTMVAALNSLRA